MEIIVQFVLLAVGFFMLVKGADWFVEGAAVADENTKKATGIISRMAQGVIDGNTHYYIVLENHKDLIFDVPITDFLGIVKYDVGDKITISYNAGEPACTVLSVEGKEGSAEGVVDTENATETSNEVS